MMLSKRKISIVSVVILLMSILGCAEDNEFYTLNLSYTGGHMGGDKVIIEVNGKRPDFFWQGS